MTQGFVAHISTVYTPCPRTIGVDWTIAVGECVLLKFLSERVFGIIAIRQAAGRLLVKKVAYTLIWEHIQEQEGGSLNKRTVQCQPCHKVAFHHSFSSLQYYLNAKHLVASTTARTDGHVRTPKRNQAEAPTNSLKAQIL